MNIENSEISFDNISSLPPTSEMVGSESEDRRDTDGPNLPDSDADHEPIAEDKGTEKETKESKSPKPKAESKRSAAKPTGDEGSDKPVSLKLNDQEWNLQELLENPEALGQLSKELEGGYLRRGDYTQKTQELAAARQSFESEKETFTNEISTYLNQVDQKFNQNPRLFVEDMFKHSEGGEIRQPQEVQRMMNDWVTKLASEIKMKGEYNPVQLNKQYELENKVLEMQKRLDGQKEQDAQAQEQQEVEALQRMVYDKATASFPAEGVLGSMIEQLPGFKEMLLGEIYKTMNDDISNTYVEGDPSWNDIDYIESYNFKKALDKYSKPFLDLFESQYGEYVKKKAGNDSPTPQGGGRSGNTKPNIDKNLTFEDIFRSY